MFYLESLYCTILLTYSLGGITMKRKLLFIFSLLISFVILNSSQIAFAQGTYELYNDLGHPITVDLYRTYWEKDVNTVTVPIETIKLNPKNSHTCDFTKTNDLDIKSYQYRIQFKTCHYIQEVTHAVGNIHTKASSIMSSNNQCFGWYRFPPLHLLSLQ